nr:MAG TPA: hypothetical protein [Caudoviricetes sp.]
MQLHYAIPSMHILSQTFMRVNSTTQLFLALLL